MSRPLQQTVIPHLRRKRVCIRCCKGYREISSLGLKLCCRHKKAKYNGRWACCGLLSSPGCVHCDHIDSHLNYDKIFVMPIQTVKNFTLQTVSQWSTLPPVINEFRNGTREELIFIIRDEDIDIKDEMQRRQIFVENILETEIEIPRAILDIQDPNGQQQTLHDDIRTRVGDVVPLTEQFQQHPYQMQF